MKRAHMDDESNIRDSSKAKRQKIGESSDDVDEGTAFRFRFLFQRQTRIISSIPPAPRFAFVELATFELDYFARKANKFNFALGFDPL